SETPGHCFSTVLTGEEFFLADHVIHGRSVLPAVVYLEMAREAMLRTSRAPLLDGTGAQRLAVSLRNVVWTRPFQAGTKPARFQLRLISRNGSDLDFEISSDAEQTGGSAVIHAQGRVGLGTTATDRSIDLSALRTRCDSAHYSAEECYRAFTAMGYHYGPAQ